LLGRVSVGLVARQTKAAPKGGFSGFTGRGSSLTIRKLIFGHDTFDRVALDAISDASVGLDGQASNDGVDLWLFKLRPALRALTSMTDGIVQPIGM
jgi:hypothetical protein